MPSLNQQKNINFCFVKYGEEVQGRPINHWIEPLCEPIKEYCNDVKFWCLTDDNRDLPDYINTIPLTNEDIHLHIHWNKIKFFDPSFIKAQPNDETIIVDIDMEWNKNPAPVIEYPIKSKEFVSMNEKAEEIGLTSTNFTNASGINDPDNYSTVRDIAKMSSYLITNYPVYYKYFAEEEYTWDRTGGNPITQGNRNPLLYKGMGADGIKTGYLAVEQYSLASSVIGDKRRLISVGSGFKSKKSRSNESIKLISWGLRNTDTYEIARKDEPTFKFKVWLGKKDFILGSTNEDIYLTISKKNSKNLNAKIKYTGPLKAPIKKGQEIGILIIDKNKEEQITAPIFASEKIEKVNFFKSLFLSFNYMIWGDA